MLAISKLFKIAIVILLMAQAQGCIDDIQGNST